VAFGEPVAGAIPPGYAFASFPSLALFGKLRRHKLFRFSQLLLNLLLPFFLMISLGGFVLSSGVVLWSLSSPLGALVFAERGQAWRWFLAYLALVLAGAFIPAGESNNLPEYMIRTFFVKDANRFLGTRICVGRPTVERSSSFFGRPVGTLHLRGRETPIDAIEPLRDEPRAREHVARYSKLFGKLKGRASDVGSELAALAGWEPPSQLPPISALSSPVARS
jgi:hypothetical protein